MTTLSPIGQIVQWPSKKQCLSLFLALLLAQGLTLTIYYFSTKRYTFDATLITNTPLARASIFPTEEISNSSIWIREGNFFVTTVFNDSFLKKILLKYPETRKDLFEFAKTEQPSDDEISAYINEEFKEQFYIKLLGEDTGTFYLQFTTKHPQIGKSVIEDGVNRFKSLSQEMRIHSLQKSLMVIENTLKDKAKQLSITSDLIVAMRPSPTPTTYGRITQMNYNLLEREIGELVRLKIQIGAILNLAQIDESSRISMIREPFRPKSASFPLPKHFVIMGLVIGIIFYFLFLILWDRSMEK